MSFSSTLKRIFSTLKAIFTDQTQFSPILHDCSLSQDDHNLCHGIGTLSNWMLISRLVKHYQKLCENYPNHRPYLIFGDEDQLEYTAMHANEFIYDNDLYFARHPDADRASPECAQFWQGAEQLTENSKENKINTLLPLDDESSCDENYALLKNIQYNAPRYFDGSVTVRLCPTNYSPDCIAVLPNGYWAGDFTPIENRILAGILFEQFGYELAGIECCWLFFIRKEPLSAVKIDELCQVLAKIYQANESKIRAALKSSLDVHTWLFLPYGEGFCSDYSDE